MKPALIILVMLCAGCENERTAPRLALSGRDGCQYSGTISSGFAYGQLVPVVSADGKQICGGAK